MDGLEDAIRESGPLTAPMASSNGGVLGWLSKQQWLISVAAILIVWQAAAMHYDTKIILPYPVATLKALALAFVDADTLLNLAITVRRVLFGFVWALGIGIPLGMAMGSSKTVRRLIGPVADSVRQVPIMAWVPLTIVWFGLGDGPTVFLIAMVGFFPILLSTVAGVDNISRDYYNAARSMGASRASIVRNVVVPAAAPDVMTGMRLALSAGWMSVI